MNPKKVAEKLAKKMKVYVINKPGQVTSNFIVSTFTKISRGKINPITINTFK
jgi:hypothetical protein